MKFFSTKRLPVRNGLLGFSTLILIFALVATTTPTGRAVQSGEQRTQEVAVVFFNNSTINVTDAAPNNTPGTGSLYPSPITVAGIGNSITNLTVRLNSVNHSFPPDLDLLLVGPAGQSFILQSDAGGNTTAVNRTYTFDGTAPTQLPVSGGLPNAISVRPGNHQGNDNLSDLFPAFAPSGPYANPGPQGGGTATLNSVFGGTNPNGIWELYVTDDEHLDTGSISGGWRLDVTAVSVPLSRVSDYDGDNKSDVAVVRALGGGSAAWYINASTAGFTAANWGTVATDRFLPQDYDGDGKTDIAVWRSTEGNWYILESQTSTFRAVNFGATGDDPSVVADYDGDGKADPAVVRSSSGSKIWYYLGSSSGFGYRVWGLSSDAPAPGDYDGDGKSDFAVRRNDDPSAGRASFYVDGTLTGFQAFSWGNSSDLIAPGDYDGDDKTDIAVGHFTGGDLFWYVRLSGGGTIENVRWGITGDLPVQGDYNGDNKTDIAVWRSSTSSFYVLYTSVGGNLFVQWGVPSDYPPANSNAH
jgi:subtilisin-like proprotein convertase family protein